MQENLRRALKEYLEYDEIITLETEIAAKQNYYFIEGQLTSILVNRYERDKTAREECKKIYNSKCQGCGIDFKKQYGNDIEDIIHVHHIVPLESIGEEKEKNVIDDLVTLCPNCHSVVHSKKGQLISIRELKERVANPSKFTIS